MVRSRKLHKVQNCGKLHYPHIISVGRAELWWGWGVPRSLKFLPEVGLGRGVKFLIYFWEGGGGKLVTPLATPLAHMLWLISGKITVFNRLFL